MPCLCPISIPDKILSVFGVKGHSLLVPCGHCSECARDRRNDWFVRLWSVYNEYRSKHLPVWFVTVTIDPNLWPQMNLKSPGVEKRISPFVRSWCERLRYLNGGKMPLRFLCSEFGSCDRDYVDSRGNVRVTTGALHFHGLLFGKLDVSFLQDGFRLTHGHVDFDLVRGPQGIRYCVKYCTKDYSIDNPLLRARTFCSPGLGDPRFYFGDGVPTPVVLINGYHYRTPRYFIDKQWLFVYGKDRFFSSIGTNVMVDKRAKDRVQLYHRFLDQAESEFRADPSLRSYLAYCRECDARRPASLGDVIKLVDLRLTGYTHPLIRYYLRLLSDEKIHLTLEMDRTFSSTNYISPFINQFDLHYERLKTVVPLSFNFET